MIRSDPWLTAQHDLATKIDAVLDQACITILELTSSEGALVRVKREILSGTDPYDHAPPMHPCDRTGICPVCGRRFWAVGGRNPRIYCTRRCQNLRPARRAAAIAYYQEHRADPDWRARQNARARLRYRGQFARAPVSA